MGYSLGFDLGTTFTAAAVVRDGRAEIVSLGNHMAVIPSVVFLREDGELLVGDAAERRGVHEPARLARAFKRRFGDSTPIMLDRSPFSADRLITVVLAQVVADVARRQGGAPDGVAVTYPANWGAYKVDLLRQAVQSAGVDAAELVTEPVAAAVRYASTERVDPGDVIAVYDLGGGTFDAAVLRKTVDGFETLGSPQGIERLGGIDFDEAVLAHVRSTLGGALDGVDTSDPAVRAGLANLRDECVAAKEALSSDADATIPVLLTNVQTQVRLTRSEFEDVIRPIVRETVQSLQRAIASAGVEPAQVKAVLLAGGSSRIPLVAEMVGAALGRPIVVDAHPKHAVALGAALVAAGRGASATMAPPLPPVVAPAAAAAAAPPPPPAAPVPSAAAAADTVPTPAVEAATAPAATTAAMPATATPAASVAADPTAPAAAAGKSKRGLLVVGGGVLASLAVVGGVLAMGGGGDDSATRTSAPASTASVSDPGATDPADPAAATVAPSTSLPESSVPTATTTPVVTASPVDPASISVEVDCDGLVAEDGLPLIGCEEGISVERVQATLDAIGYAVDVDGQYGTQTATAVAQFQNSLGLTSNGQVDSATWEALGLDLSTVCDRSLEQWVCLSDAWIDGSWMNATYEWSGFTPAASGGNHFHFYGNTLAAFGAGAPADADNWVVWDDDTLRVATNAAASFSGASELCVLVGNADHTVVANSGNCVPIRASSTAAPTVSIVPNWEVIDTLRPIISIPIVFPVITTTTTVFVPITLNPIISIPITLKPGISIPIKFPTTTTSP